MPYCRKCGAKLEENAQFCHKCGTQAVKFTPPHLARPTSKSLLSTPEIVLIVVTIVAIIVIASVFVFITFNHLNMNQTNSSNQTNFSSFIFKIHEGRTENDFSAPDLFGKASFITGAVSSLQRNNRLSLPAY